MRQRVTAEPIRRLVFTWQRTVPIRPPAEVKCGSPHRHPIVIRRDPQQHEPRFGAVEGLGYPSAFFGAGAIPATKRNTSSHGDLCCKYVFLHID
jgi:hypothetical protein